MSITFNLSHNTFIPNYNTSSRTTRKYIFINCVCFKYFIITYMGN